MGKRDSSCIAKFRCGVTPLQVEVGPYNGTKLEDRKCILSSRNEIEDECYTFIRCNLYNDIRSELFDRCERFVDFNSLSDTVI